MSRDKYYYFFSISALPWARFLVLLKCRGEANTLLIEALPTAAALLAETARGDRGAGGSLGRRAARAAGMLEKEKERSMAKPRSELGAPRSARAPPSLPQNLPLLTEQATFLLVMQTALQWSGAAPG